MESIWSAFYWVGWDGLTALATVGLAVLGLITVLYAKRQLSDFRNESRVKHLMDLVSEFEREPLATYRRNLAVRRAPGGTLQPLDQDDPPPELHNLLNFFEHMAYLLDEKYLDLNGVSVEFHYWIFHIWADAHKLVKQEQLEDAAYYELFEKMVKLLEERERQHTNKFELPSNADLQYFYAEEAHLPTGSPLPRQKRSRHLRD